jgi:hypothetical protein
MSFLQKRKVLVGTLTETLTEVTKNTPISPNVSL